MSNIDIGYFTQTEKYANYILLSKQLLSSITNDEDKIIDRYFEYPGLYKRKELKYNLSWVHQLLKNNKHVFLKSVVLEKSKISLSSRIFKSTDLSITYSLGRAGCSDPTYDNNITIIFSDISKGESHFEFRFDNCRESEKLKKKLLDIHP